LGIFLKFKINFNLFVSRFVLKLWFDERNSKIAVDEMLRRNESSKNKSIILYKFIPKIRKMDMGKV